jgi:hypothetical protein
MLRFCVKIVQAMRANLLASAVPADRCRIRKLIRDISLANPLWGAPRIHGELLKLGITIGQTTVAKYMVRTRRPPSQGWKTFLRNHANGIHLLCAYANYYIEPERTCP